MTRGPRNGMLVWWGAPPTPTHPHTQWGKEVLAATDVHKGGGQEEGRKKVGHVFQPFLKKIDLASGRQMKGNEGW